MLHAHKFLVAFDNHTHSWPRPSFPPSLPPSFFPALVLIRNVQSLRLPHLSFLSVPSSFLLCLTLGKDH